MSDRNYFYELTVEGIGKLRNGIGVIIFSAVLGLVAYLIGVPDVIAFGVLSLKVPSLVSVSSASLIAGILAVIIVSIINIIGLFLLKFGFDELEEITVENVGIGSIGVLIFFAAIILSIITILIALANPILGLGLVIFASIVDIIAQVMIELGIRRVGLNYKESLTSVAGILVAIPLPIIPFIGYILSYVGLGRITENLKLEEPLISQTEQGIIKGGKAYISLSSNVRGKIKSAQVEGQLVKSIIPEIITPGDNNLVIDLSNLSLVLGKTYVIILTIETEKGTIETRAYATYYA